MSEWPATFNSSEAITYLDNVFGDRPGYVMMAFYRNRAEPGVKPAYHPDDMDHTVPFKWPADKPRLLQRVSDEITRGRVDVFICPYLRGEPNRKAGSAAPLYVAWADMDADPAGLSMSRRLERLRAIPGLFVVASGSGRHIGVRTTDEMDGVIRRAISRLLSSACGAKDAKVADNDLLRLPGTWNCKTRPPLPVTVKKVKPPADAKKVIVSLEKVTGQSLQYFIDNDTITTDVDLEGDYPPLPARIKGSDKVGSIWHLESGDRSRDLFGIVCGLAELTGRYQLDRDQIIGAMIEHPMMQEKWDHKGGRAAIIKDTARILDKWESRNLKATGEKLVDPSDRPTKVNIAGGGSVDIGQFWSERPLLGHIYAYARSRYATEWAVLGVVLARVIVATPPWVVLPPTVGTKASLNFAVNLVGKSGSGKDIAQDVAAESVVVGKIDQVGPGTGEGIESIFVNKDKNGVQHQVRQAALMYAGEVELVTKLAGRTGATLMPVLRAAISGSGLGFSNRDQAKSLTVDKHSYRLAMVMGVQPEMAGPILGDGASGTPQRFIWLPATDPDMARVEWPTPAPWIWEHPGALIGELGEAETTDADGHFVLPVCPSACEATIEAKLNSGRGGNGLDGHANMARLKVAAALGFLDGRAEITEDDWRLSGVVMEVSDAQRDAVVSLLADSERKKNEFRGEMEFERDHAKATRHEKAIRDHINRKLSDGEWRSGGKVLEGLNTRYRGDFKMVLSDMIGAGVVERRETTYRGQTGFKYRWSEGGN